MFCFVTPCELINFGHINVAVHFEFLFCLWFLTYIILTFIDVCQAVELCLLTVKRFRPSCGDRVTTETSSGLGWRHSHVSVALGNLFMCQSILEL